MFNDSTEPYNGGDTSGYVSSGITDPGPTRPTWTPGGNGFWELIGGVWHWMTDPSPRGVRTTD